MDIGDCVKILRISKGGKSYYDHGVIIDKDTYFSDLFYDKNQKTTDDRFIKYTIITDESDEIVEYGNSVEFDKNMERQIKLNRILKN